MPRPITFDHDEVIDCVVSQFWKHGFEGTSMKNICDATGLQPGSIYAAFGNKRALFFAAIDAYFEKSIATLSGLLHGPGSPLQRIRALLSYTVTEVCRKDSHGCMLVNALLETPADDRALRQHIVDAFSALEASIESVLGEAVACGELPAEKDTAVLAKLVVNHVYGLRVHSRLEPEFDTMMAVVDELLAGLRRPG